MARNRREDVLSALDYISRESKTIDGEKFIVGRYFGMDIAEPLMNYGVLDKVCDRERWLYIKKKSGYMGKGVPHVYRVRTDSLKELWDKCKDAAAVEIKRIFQIS